jgi:hypothetical protein
MGCGCVEAGVWWWVKNGRTNEEWKAGKKKRGRREEEMGTGVHVHKLHWNMERRLKK